MQIDLRNRGLEVFDPSAFEASDADRAILVHIADLDLSHNALYSTLGFAGLTQLHTLNLSHNGIQALSDAGLPLSLVRLNLSHNGIVSLHRALLPLHRLQELDLSYNQLGDLKGIPGDAAPALRVLRVTGNQLSCLTGLELCGSLQELHAANNLLREANHLSALRSLAQLRVLVLEGNPILGRKRQVRALQALLPEGLELIDVPNLSAIPSTDTSYAINGAGAPSHPVVDSAITPQQSTQATSSMLPSDTRRNAEPGNGSGPTATACSTTCSWHLSSSQVAHRPPSPRDGFARDNDTHPNIAGGGASLQAVALPPPPPPPPPVLSHSTGAPEMVCGIPAAQIQHPYNCVKADDPRHPRPSLSLLAELDAYKTEIATLTQRIRHLEASLAEQQAATAASLSHNAQLQRTLAERRLHIAKQSHLPHAPQLQHTHAAAAPTVPPLAPPPQPLAPTAATSTTAAGRLIPAPQEVGLPAVPYTSADTSVVSNTVLSDVSAQTTASVEQRPTMQRQSRDRRQVAAALMACLRS